MKADPVMIDLGRYLAQQDAEEREENERDQDEDFEVPDVDDGYDDDRFDP